MYVLDHKLIWQGKKEIFVPKNTRIHMSMYKKSKYTVITFDYV